MNAKLGRESGNETIIGKYTSGSQNDRGRLLTEMLTNDRGRLLTEMLTRLECRAWNTFFRKRKGRIWTWRSPNGTVRNQIDFICSPPSTTVLDCGVVSKFPFNSDHRVVRMQLLARQSPHRKFVRPSRLLTRTHLDRELYKSYDSIRAFVETAAKDCWTISYDPPRITPRTQLLLYERITLRNDPSPEGRIAYSTACKAARIALHEDIRRGKIAIVQKAIEKGRSLNEALRKGNHKVRRLMIKDPTTGEYSQQATEAIVSSYYNELYSSSIDFSFSVPPSFELCSPFCIDEAEHALSQLRLGRSPGPDRISAEQIALAKSSVAHSLTVLLNSIKRGDPIPGSLTTAHQIAEKSKEYNFPVYVALIDYKKAFDSLEWNAVWTALGRRGIHPELIEMLRKLYESSSTSVLVNAHPVPVTIRRGIKQGDTMSPKLFNATLQMVLESIDWRTCGLRIGGKILSSLEYADDVALLASTRSMLEKMIRLLAAASAKVGLQINPEKSTLLPNNETPRQPIRIDGKTFNFAEHAIKQGKNEIAEKRDDWDGPCGSAAEDVVVVGGLTGGSE
ncbi:reverse transcriptase [Ancylostoma ceylanicum]|uniref:Reverse transcriptase n=1 Tax=Ancylostoma ceylanicum TaxID=53326 RepID=A0A0D6LLD5_9BILA|nr:reverse transcriptase [Ancylostoma ceylanicum]